MKSLEECKKIINDFAVKHKLIFEEQGTVGFGRECVGLTNGSNYVEYNPINMDTYDHIEDYYSEELYKITPEDCYHKHDCLAVLGRGEKAIRQLCDWVESLESLNITVVDYDTGAKGFQALLSGTTSKTIKIPNKKP